VKKKTLQIIKPISFPILSVLIALVISAIIMTIMGHNAASAYRSLLNGAFGGMNAFAETLVQATPLIFMAMAYAVAYKCGIINLGAEGQLHIGAIFGAFVGARFGFLPEPLHLMFVIICGIAGGAMWGLIAGALKMKFGASELITTIMLNFIALEFVSFSVTNDPFRDLTPGAAPRMTRVVEAVQLPNLVPGTRLHVGILIAIFVLIIYYIFMWKTTKGYEMRVVGQNPSAGRYSGINIGRNSLLALVIGGGIAGLGGVVNLIGLQFFMTEGFSNNFGFSGVAVALVGGGHPIGILLAGVFFGALNAGGIRMQVSAQVPAAATLMIQGLIILFVVSKELFTHLEITKNRLFKRGKKAAIGGESDA
jgi:simple sugar transport system permease protein